MPPLPKLRVAALRDLDAQLRFASREALLRDLARAEALAQELEPERLYPETWVIERVTGYKPRIDDPATLVGEAVLGDLSSLVERLCAAAALRAAEVNGDCITPEELCRRWSVSRKSLDRYRRSGLIARRIIGEDGRVRLVFPRAMVERFEQVSGDRIASAGRYSRIDDGARERVLARASELHAQGRSLNDAALSISREIGRSHEAIRQLLKRHDERAEEPIFGERGPVTPREKHVAFRAWQRGIDPPMIARRLERSPASVRRAINVRRADLLAALQIPAGEAVVDMEAALAPEPARRWTCEPPPDDLPGFLAWARGLGAPIAAEERQRSLAMRALLADARERIAQLNPSVPIAQDLDCIETNLRHALRLRVSLTRAQLPQLVRTLENRVGRPLETVRGTSLRSLLEGGVASLALAVERFDPERGARLAARAGMAIDRFASDWMRGPGRELADRTRMGRASPRLAAGTPIEPWTRIAAGPLAWLDLDPRAPAALPALDDELRRVLECRFGLAEPPLTLDALCERTGLGRVAAPRMERRAIRETMRLARLASA